MTVWTKLYQGDFTSPSLDQSNSCLCQLYKLSLPLHCVVTNSSPHERAGLRTGYRHRVCAFNLIRYQKEGFSSLTTSICATVLRPPHTLVTIFRRSCIMWALEKSCFALVVNELVSKGVNIIKPHSEPVCLEVCVSHRNVSDSLFVLSGLADV